MVTLDGIGILADIDLCGNQADVADVMLRTGVVAAGEMDVERRIDLDPRLAPVANPGRMQLGVRRREFAPRIAGAGDQPSADLRSLDVEPDSPDRGDRKIDIG